MKDSKQKSSDPQGAAIPDRQQSFLDWDQCCPLSKTARTGDMNGSIAVTPQCGLDDAPDLTRKSFDLPFVGDPGSRMGEREDAAQNQVRSLLGTSPSEEHLPLPGLAHAFDNEVARAPLELLDSLRLSPTASLGQVVGE